MSVRRSVAFCVVAGLVAGLFYVHMFLADLGGAGDHSFLQRVEKLEVAVNGGASADDTATRLKKVEALIGDMAKVNQEDRLEHKQANLKLLRVKKQILDKTATDMAELQQQVSSLTARVDSLLKRQDELQKAIDTVDVAKTPEPPTPEPTPEPPWEVRRKQNRVRRTIKEDAPAVEDMMREFIEAGILIPKAKGVPLTGMSLIEGNFTIPFDKFQGNVTLDSLQTMKNESGCWEADDKAKLVPAKPSVPVVFCALVRNRVKITMEWVMWHHMLGVQHFEIFDDYSEDGLEEQLAFLVAQGIVTYHKAPTPPFWFGKQREQNNVLLGSWDVCRKKYRKTEPKTWLGFIDIDEFVVLLGGNETMKSPLCIPQAVVKTIERVGADKMGGVALPWRIAPNRNNYADTFPSQLVRTNFNRGMQDQFFALKTIVRADLPFRSIWSAGHITWIPEPFDHFWVDGRVATTPERDNPCPGYYDCVNLKANESSPVYSHGFVMHYSRLSMKGQLMRALDGHADYKEMEPLNIMNVDYFFRNLGQEGPNTGALTAMAKEQRPLSTNTTFSWEELALLNRTNAVLLKGLGLTWDGSPAP